MVAESDRYYFSGGELCLSSAWCVGSGYCLRLPDEDVSCQCGHRGLVINDRVVGVGEDVRCSRALGNDDVYVLFFFLFLVLNLSAC